jgi:hypothetical protein
LVFLNDEVGRFSTASENRSISKIVVHDHRPDRREILA